MRNTCSFESCNQPFESKREDARYCSASCRAKASRERRAEESSRTGAAAPAPSRPLPTARPQLLDRDERLRALEERVMDLEGDLEAAVSQRDGLQNQQARLEALVAQAIEVAEEARSAAAAAALSAVEPFQQSLFKLSARLPAPNALAELRAEVARINTRLSTQRESPRSTGHLVERLDELEQAVITLAQNVGCLRSEIDGFANALNSALD